MDQSLNDCGTKYIRQRRARSAFSSLGWTSVATMFFTHQIHPTVYRIGVGGMALGIFGYYITDYMLAETMENAKFIAAKAALDDLERSKYRIFTIKHESSWGWGKLE